MTETDSGHPAAEAEDAATRAKRLLQGGRLKEALEVTRAELIENPANAEALYIQAVTLRYLDQPAQALETLEQLKERQPAHSRAYQEEGHNLKLLGDFRRATAAYQRAVDLNHALLASWRDLTDKYACTLSQLVIAWTAAQPGVTHVLAGGRNVTQATENAKAGELTLETADLERIRKDVIALGEPVKA